MSEVRVRFAPSPTGDPHIGNVRTALFNWLFARHCGGKFILRIEDTDTARYQEGSAQAIFETLQWLGLDWDEGPGVGGTHAPYFQSQRKGIYDPLVQRLLDEGHAYRCYCSQERLAALREEQQMNKQSTGYDRRCRSLPATERAELESSGAPFTVRLKMPVDGVTTFHDRLRGDISFQNATKIDPVLIKADGMPLYHFAHVVDDHLMGITHVLRSEEWISSAPIHLRLYEAFGWQPPEIIHVPLVLDMDGRKLSKRRGHAGTLQHRDDGYLPEALVNFLALLGWSPGDNREIMTREELIAAFSLDGLISSSARFDRTKLDWMNGAYIRALTPTEMRERSHPFLVAAGLVPEHTTADQAQYEEQVVTLEQARLHRLAEVPALSQFFFLDQPTIEEKAQRKWLERPGARAVLERYLAAIERVPFAAADLEAAARGVAEEMNLGTGPVFHPVRVAVSGRTEGPSLFEMMAVMGRERTTERIRSALQIAQP